MAFPGILRKLFENEGAGPLLQPNLFRQTNYTTTLTTSGTQIVPYDGYWRIRVQAGGGGGGSCIRTAGVDCGAIFCSGGQAGECVEFVRWYAKGAVINYTVGAGGVGGSAESSALGSPGGSTTFDGISAAGGAGGDGQVSPQVNTVFFSSPRIYAHNGAAGDSGAPGSFYLPNHEFYLCYSGKGGGTIFGQGGGSVYAYANSAAAGSAYAGKDGSGYGSGGGGAAANNSSSGGGKGAPGCVQITYLGV